MTPMTPLPVLPTCVLCHYPTKNTTTFYFKTLPVTLPLCDECRMNLDEKLWAIQDQATPDTNQENDQGH